MVESLEKSNLVSDFFNSNTNINVELLHSLEIFLEEQKKKIQASNIPVSIFASKELGILEALVKYLKENQNLELKNIALMLNRDQATVWNSYNDACKKHPEMFKTNSHEFFIDISIFHNRELAPLQALVKHLKESGISFNRIAELLNRDYKTVWLTYNNKNGKHAKKRN